MSVYHYVTLPLSCRCFDRFFFGVSRWRWRNRCPRSLSTSSCAASPRGSASSTTSTWLEQSRPVPLTDRILSFPPTLPLSLSLSLTSLPLCTFIFLRLHLLGTHYPLSSSSPSSSSPSSSPSSSSTASSSSSSSSSPSSSSPSSPFSPSPSSSSSSSSSSPSSSSPSSSPSGRRTHWPVATT